MKIGKTIKNWGRKVVVAATLASTLMSGAVRAEDSGMPLAMRAKAEYTGDFEKPGELRQTFGLGMPGVYDGRTAVPGQFIENFRAVSKETDLKNDYIFGLRGEPQKLLKNDSSFIPVNSLVWGALDNKGLANSIASENIFKANDTTLIFRQEFQDGQNSLSHLGGTIEQKIGQFTPGFGFDRSSESKGNMDYIFANLIYDVTPNDFSAITFANQKLADGTESNRARFTLGHYGPKESFGHRSFVEHDWDNKGMQSFTAHTIVAPFGASTFSRVANRLLTGNRIADDDSFKMARTPFAFYTEDVPEYDRIVGDNIAERGFSLRGLGFRGDYSIKKDTHRECALVGGKILYVGRLGKALGQNEVGVSIGAVYERNYGVATTILTGGATVRLGKHFSVGGAVKAPTNNPSSPGVNVWGELKF